MHEILAVIIWTLENSDGSSKREESDGEVLTSPILEPVPISGALSNILSKSYVEHDAYVLFSAVMVHLGQLYVANDVYDEPPREGLSADEVAEFALSKSDAVGDEKPPIVLTLCNEIQHRRLRAADRAVHHNLAALTIEPQLYGLRWTRLLFCREFPMAVVHRLWDAMFAALYFKAQPDTSDSGSPFAV
jgi:TBC1 domain family member 5